MMILTHLIVGSSTFTIKKQFYLLFVDSFYYIVDFTVHGISTTSYVHKDRQEIQCKERKKIEKNGVFTRETDLTQNSSLNNRLSIYCQ